MSGPSGGAALVELGRDDVDVVLDVLCDAFFDYPVMRYVLGGGGEEYAARLRTLIRFFVMARATRGETVLGAGREGRIDAVAIVSRPGAPTPPELEIVRAHTWDALGPQARSRYAAFGAATAPFDLDEPHHHLNMIGVRARAQGTGLSGVLLERVHAASAADPTSVGVTLSTEHPANVPFYERHGYRLTGHARVSDELETWCFFRPDDA